MYIYNDTFVYVCIHSCLFIYMYIVGVYPSACKVHRSEIYNPLTDTDTYMSAFVPEGLLLAYHATPFQRQPPALPCPGSQ